MRLCLFCDKPAETAEHAWPDWILRKLQPSTIGGEISGTQINISATKAEIKVKCVCGACNNGWMSDLESDSKPLIEPMMKDLPMPITLDITQQFILSRWVVKTAIVWEAIVRRFRASRYPDSVRNNLRRWSRLPPRTSVWLGRYVGEGVLGAYGHDVRYEIATTGSNYGTGYAFTMVVGHLAIQLFTLHVSSEYKGQPVKIPAQEGNWERSLVRIYPAIVAMVRWPPPESFSSIQVLARKWSLGEQKSLLR